MIDSTQAMKAIKDLTLEQFNNSLRLRVVLTSSLTEPKGVYISKRLTKDLSVVVVIDLPDYIATPDRATLKYLNISEDNLFSVALDNIRTQVNFVVEDKSQFFRVISETPYTESFSLVLYEHPYLVGAFGTILVSIRPQVLAVLPINSREEVLGCYQKAISIAAYPENKPWGQTILWIYEKKVEQLEFDIQNQDGKNIMYIKPTRRFSEFLKGKPA